VRWRNHFAVETQQRFVCVCVLLLLLLLLLLAFLLLSYMSLSNV